MLEKIIASILHKCGVIQQVQIVQTVHRNDKTRLISTASVLKSCKFGCMSFWKWF
jgi:hypothetical protein